MTTVFWLVARKKPALLIDMMHALSGDAHISFEGDLSHCRFSSIPGASEVETEILKRQAIAPVRDFIVLPLEANTIEPILKQILPEFRVVGYIDHILIEKAGKLEFASYDRFYPDCIVCYSGVPATLLEELLAKGVLRSFKMVEV